MITVNKIKGNPAHHRMSNAQKKALRAACWARGQRRKAARINAQNERHENNMRTIAEGGKTPWMIATAKRREARG